MVRRSRVDKYRVLEPLVESLVLVRREVVSRGWSGSAEDDMALQRLSVAMDRVCEAWSELEEEGDG